MGSDRSPDKQAKGSNSNNSERFTFVSSGRRLQAYVWGSVAPFQHRTGQRLTGQHRTVLLIHGWGGHGRQFEALIERLVDAEFRVVSLDLPAHGSSAGCTTNAFEMRSAVLDLVRGEHTDAAHVGPLHAVIAHSFGAMVTALALDEGLGTKFCAFVAPMTSFNYAVSAFSGALGLSPRLRDRMVARLEAQFAISSAGMEVAQTAASRSVPLLVVHDSDDTRVPFDLGRTLVEAWPGAKLHATSGLGHQRVLADPAVVDELVRFVSAGPAKVEPLGRHDAM